MEEKRGRGGRGEDERKVDSMTGNPEFYSWHYMAPLISAYLAWVVIITASQVTALHCRAELPVLSDLPEHY